MTATLDPYQRWLGIPPAEQPPHHYRLLGVPAFETDLAVIGRAADRQTVRIKSFLAGSDASEAERLLTEIAAARRCLFDAPRRAEYDAKLRIRLTAAEVARAPSLANADAAANQAFSRPLPRATEAPPIAVVDREREPIEPPPRQALAPQRLPSARKSSFAVPLFAVGGLVALVLAIVAGLAMPGLFGSRKQPPETTHETSKAEPRSAVRKIDRAKTSKPTTPDSPVEEVNKFELPELKLKSDDVSKTDYSIGSPLGEGLDLKALPDDDSLPGRFKLVLLGVRRALATRDAGTARALLAQAKQSKSSPLDATEIDHLETLEKYVGAFWQAARKGLDQVKPGDKFTFETEEYELLKRDGDVVTFNLGGVKQEAKIAELNPRAAAAFASRAASAREPLSLVHAGAFLAIDQQGDPSERDWQKAYARRLWQNAAELGEKDPYLAKELGIDPIAHSPAAKSPKP